MEARTQEHRSGVVKAKAKAKAKAKKVESHD
jgi:hypothetical protein